MEESQSGSINEEKTETPGGLISGNIQTNPNLTIKSKAPCDLIYEIDPDKLPTETITHAGHRVFIDETGELCESQLSAESHYEVIDKISEGGMGVVYNVTDNSLHREVALKICRAGNISTAAHSHEAEEFTNEAYMTAHLDHPGVIPIYALAKDADGRPFFAMKKVSGTSWRALLHPEYIKDPNQRTRLIEQSRKMTWKDHLEIFLKVCDATAYAHSKSIMHRDLKPENIMLGDYGEVYVMDWGLAMYFDERNEYRRIPDLNPQLAGTPYYMAPEMVRGEMILLGPASDVYLLGGILYEIMTGRPPHQGEGVIDLLKKVVNDKVPPPREICDSPFITLPLSQIIMKALAPVISDRYQDVLSLQQDLRNYLENSESMTVCNRALEEFRPVQHELLSTPTDIASPLKMVNKDEAAICYGRLSECIGSFRQAIELWPGNVAARNSLLEALIVQIRLAIHKDDLTLARSQCRLLSTEETFHVDESFSRQAKEYSRDLVAEIEWRQKALSSATRQAHIWKAVAATLSLLVLMGLGIIAYMGFHQRSLAIQNERNMFAASVTSRAQMLEQFMINIENIAVLYQQTAQNLMSCPMNRLPYQPDTPAGRNGFYFDEDYYNPGTRPRDMTYDKRYNSVLSMSYPTVVRAPWARGNDRKPAVEHAAARLGRLNTIFSQIHHTRNDIQWSLAGSEEGLLIGFPGYGRYKNKPDYDPTQRTWYTAAINAPNDRPVWGNPYADASTKLMLMSCISRIHVDGRNVGVVGLEVTLDTLQRLLLDFTQSVGGRKRCLLIRPFMETDKETGQTKSIHRVVVDTQYKRSAADWRDKLDMADINDTGEEIATYYRNILEDKYPPGFCHETGKILITHAKLKAHDWVLIVILEHDN